MTIRTREDIKKMVKAIMKPPKKPKKKEQEQIFNMKKKDIEVKRRKIKIRRRKKLNRTSNYQANI